MGAVQIERYTYEDYKHWQGDWELIFGSPYAMAPSPMRIHQNIAYEIARVLGNELEKKGCKRCEVLGEFDYKISNDTVLRPDVVLTCNEINQHYLTKAPQIIVEVISPSTAKKDEEYKFGIYEFEKVKYYILVYPEDLKAKIFKIKDDKYTKVGDFTTESYDFEESECRVNLDFKKVFERFRS